MAGLHPVAKIRIESTCRLRLEENDTVLVIYGYDSASVSSNESRQQKIGFFLDGIYLMNLSGNVRRATDYVVGYIDDLLNEGNFTDCDEILKRADITQLSPPLTVSLLGMTLAAKERLQFRGQFYGDVKKQLVSERGQEGAERLLSKYR